MDIQGHCDERFASVRDAFARNFEKRGDVGASYAITLEGEYVVDIWGGCRDEARSLPWEADTIVNVYSTTKTMAAICALLLADRGEIDLYAPVTTYWPEFGQNGKEKVAVRHFLSHSAGLAGLDESVSGEGLYDHDQVAKLLAAQAPWWEPGTQSGYHAITQGYLIGEVVRRVSGRSLGQFFAEEIAGPLGADFHIGLDPKHFPRVGELVPAPGSATLGGGAKGTSIAARAFRSPATRVEDSRTEGWRRAELPAVNGHGNARSVTRVQSVLANGGSAFGVKLMSPEGCARIFDEQTDGRDLVLRVPLRFGMGYGLNSPGWPLSPNSNTCFWGGWGGSLVVVDADARLCFSYVMNQMTATTLGDKRAAALAYATYECLANA